jgi:pimeloyl-ACP methyl ester carboxylesterase
VKIKTKYYLEMITTNGVELNTLIAGDQSNPLIILLHGFPEYMKGWEKQVDDLVEAGYYVIAPDQRGYGKSDKPRGIKNYKMSTLALDIIGLLDHFKRDKAVIAGHDWGAAVAWYLTAHHSDRVEKLIIVNVPHGSVFGRYLKTDKEQKKKSRYILQFQVPLLPEWLFARRNFKLGVNTLAKTSIRGTFDDGDFEEYRQAWGSTKGVSRMINWYRAAVLKKTKVTETRINPPTLIIWGEKDKFLKKEMAKDSLDYCEDGRLEYIEEATHWVLHEKPEAVNPLIISFLKG